MLIDVTKCIGCRSCQVSCKSWNYLDSERTSFENTVTNPPKMSADTYTVVEFIETEKNERPIWRFIKHMCMHCKHPACVSACFAKAITKAESGAVVYDSKTCVGCRYCMLACPWWIPKYEWNKTFPKVKKCRFCIDLLDNGKEPACATSCPTAIKFGDRDDMIAIAKQRIKDNPDKYIDHIYGENEVGGTSVLYISDIPFEELGLTANLPKEPLPDLTWDALKKVPYLAGGIAAGMTGLYFLFNRKQEVANEENNQKR